MNEDIRELLTRGASDAVDTDLVSGIWRRAHRHRRNRNLGIASLAAAGVALTFALTQIGGPGDEATIPADHTATRTAPVTQEPDTPALPEGWRWESFGGVQVGVPDEWDWGGPSQRIYQWCLNDEDELNRPIVGVAGASTAVGCDLHGPSTPPKDSLVENTGEVVMFDWSREPSSHAGEVGDRTTVERQGVTVLVQARQPLRNAIVATIHTVDTDVHGCPATHPITDDSMWRPGGIALGDVRGVTEVSVCRYQLRDARQIPVNDTPGTLMSSRRIEGHDAEQAVEAMTQAPVGGGPNNPDQCAPDIRLGEEAIVLQVTSAAGTTEIAVRYSGCDHHGFDDGHQVRTLTAEALAPFIAGPNLPDHASSEVADIVFPDTGQD